MKLVFLTIYNYYTTLMTSMISFKNDQEANASPVPTIVWEMDYDLMVRYVSVIRIQSLIRGYLVRNRKGSVGGGLRRETTSCPQLGRLKINNRRTPSLRKRRRMVEITQGGDGDSRLFADNLAQEDSIDIRKRRKASLLNVYNSRRRTISKARERCRLSKSCVF